MNRYPQNSLNQDRFPEDDATWNDSRPGASTRGTSGTRPSSRSRPDSDNGWDDAYGGTLPPPRSGGSSRGWDNAGGRPPPPPPGRAPRNQAPRRHSHLAREIIETIVLTALIFFAIRLSVQTFRVEGPSMQGPNPQVGLYTNEYVLVNKLAYLFHGPSRGDVIVFHYPVDPTQDFIKRVIGLPGDTLTITNTTIAVDGKILNEPYISDPVNARPISNLKLGADQYFVMGDNRPYSSDSRSWGPVPSSYIVGKATLVFWPLSNWEVIPTYSSVYAGLPSGNN